MASIERTKTVQEAAAYLRRERKARGWTARDLAERIEEVARATGDEVSLTQQAVSYFETGKTKSIPRWLRHVNAVLVFDDVERRGIGSVAEHHRNELDDDLTDDDLSYQERQWLDWLRAAAPDDRRALLHMAERLASASSPTLHDEPHTYRGEKHD